VEVNCLFSQFNILLYQLFCRVNEYELEIVTYLISLNI